MSQLTYHLFTAMYILKKINTRQKLALENSQRFRDTTTGFREKRKDE